ncbi:MAG: protein jag [Clostridia bacterium]|nr:protein jag [Clostridia bacterium]
MEFTGKTVEEAIENGLKELSLEKEEAEITVIEEPTKGLFGKMKGKAVVSIEKKATGNESATKFIQKVLDILDINAKAQLDEEAKETTINVIAENSSEVIGYRGEVLDALQTLAGAIANIGNKEYKKVVVNCENYRERREETLVSLAHRLEEKAVSLRRSVILEPMSPFERRIIHTALADSQTVKTESEGKGMNRYVVIIPNDKDEFSKPYNAGRNQSFRRGNDKKNGKGFKKGFSDKREKKSSGFTENKRVKSSGFGTYLGNSLK